MMLPDWKTVQILHEERVKEHMNPKPNRVYTLVLWSKPKFSKVFRAIMQRVKTRKQKPNYQTAQHYKNAC